MYEGGDFMTVTGEVLFVSCNKGTGKKTGKDWYALKFLDRDAELFFTCFTNKEIFEAMDGKPKDSPVYLTLILVPSAKAGRAFFDLKNIELLN